MRAGRTVPGAGRRVPRVRLRPGEQHADPSGARRGRVVSARRGRGGAAVPLQPAGRGHPRATLLPQPALRQTLLRAEEATALGRELRRRWAGTTVALQTPGRRLQPMVLLGAWQELAQYEPFASAPHPASLLTAVRRHLNQRLCCGWLALGAVLPARWLGCAAGPATGTTSPPAASGTETEAAGGTRRARWQEPWVCCDYTSAAVRRRRRSAICVPNADAHAVVGRTRRRRQRQQRRRRR